MIRTYIASTIALVGLLAMGCAESVPASSDDVILHRTETILVCAPDMTESETAFAATYWGVKFGCESSDIVVTVAPFDDGHLGHCADGKIQISPLAWDRPDQPPDLVLAHELGHLWVEHNDGDPCDVMASDGWDVECIRNSL